MSKKVKKVKKEDVMSIPEFFSGKSVFVTGGTGFMGKVLVEKLLRSCPDIDKIFLLMRPKKGKTVEERLKEILQLPMFVKVKRLDETLFEKVIPIVGDTTKLNLGLSDEDLKTLVREVSVIFHVAASVRFDDTLKYAVLMNTRGTHEILKLSSQMKFLESFVYVSTTYSNTHKKVIEEKIYPPPGDWRKIIKIAENYDNHTLETYASKILGEFPNTYTFTKALAEQVCSDFREKVPLTIFRPSVVISSLLEPVPGWVDNFNGPVGLLVGSGKGVVRTIFSDPNAVSDYIPVDLAIRAMITAAWHRATSRELESDIPVFNGSSYGIVTVSQQRLTEIARHVTEIVPLNDIIWYPTATLTTCKFIYYWEVLLLHVLQAIIVDSVLKLFNKKPMLLKLQRRIYHANDALIYFVTKQWSFTNDRLFELNEKILDEDMEDFDFLKTDVDIIEYFVNATYGIRQYMLKEDNTEIAKAKEHMRKMYWVSKFANLSVLILIVYLSIKLSVIQTLRNGILFMARCLV